MSLLTGHVTPPKPQTGIPVQMLTGHVTPPKPQTGIPVQMQCNGKKNQQIKRQ